MAVVRPDGVEDVQRLLRWAHRTRTPVVARGGGTSLDGESVPVDGGVVVDFSGWDRRIEVRPGDRFARVDPGVSQPRLEAALLRFGLTYPPNPGSGPLSTLGGHVATNASGPRSFLYGSTRAWVRSLDVVDGRGRAWRAGGSTPKRSVGPDLVGVLVGSEGTLGLFTGIGVRLARRPERRVGFAIPLRRTVDLARWAVRGPEVLGAGGSALEYVDRGTSEGLATPLGAARAPGGWVLAEWEGSASESASAETRVRRRARALGTPGPVAVYPDADELWRRRGEAGPGLERTLGPTLREDVVVPPTALGRLVGAVRSIADAQGVPVAIFGHLGDGNLHPTFGVDPTGPRAARIRTALLNRTLALGGAISGEHGIGATKRHRLAAQLGPEALDLLRTLKRRLDPAGILNPGKLLP